MSLAGIDAGAATKAARITAGFVTATTGNNLVVIVVRISYAASTVAGVNFVIVVVGVGY